MTFRLTISALLAISIGGGRAIAQDDDSPSVPSVVESAATGSKRVSHLIEQLGAANYGSREAATSELIHLGHQAHSQLEAATRSPNLEVRTRAARILALIARDSFEQRIRRFEEDTTGELGATLPGWEMGKVRLGDSGSARQFFASMYRAEPQLFESYAVQPANAVDIVTQRVTALQQEIRNNASTSWGANLPAEQRERYAPSVAALLFVLIDPQLEPSQPALMQFPHVWESVWSPEQLDRSHEKSWLRQWLGEWISLYGLQRASQYEAISLGIRFKLVQALRVSESVLRSNDPPNHVLGRALLAVGEFGDRSHRALIEPFLENQQRLHTITHRVNNHPQRLELQVRDVALISLLLLTDQELSDYGFDRISPEDLLIHQFHAMAFDAESRKKAFNKWNKWRTARLETGLPPEVPAPPATPDANGFPPQPE